MFLMLALFSFCNTWYIALCSESNGIILVFFNLALLRSKYPALIIDSLFAIASIFTLPILEKVGLSPAIPTIAEIKMSTFRLATSQIAL